MYELYSQILLTAESIGLKVISDDKCCQLLSWLYHIGGNTEASTHNKKLFHDINAAARRLNFNDGTQPNIHLLPLLRRYYDELSLYIIKKSDKPEWLEELEKHYGLKPYKHT